MKKTHIEAGPEDADVMEEDEVSYDEVDGVVGGLDHGWWPDRSTPGDSPPDLF
jgi:hypothetical protein